MLLSYRMQSFKIKKKNLVKWHGHGGKMEDFNKRGTNFRRMLSRVSGVIRCYKNFTQLRRNQGCFWLELSK